MTRFTVDNTDGYTAEQLAELNRRYEKRLETYPDRTPFWTNSDPHFFGKKAVEDYVSEQVLIEFDTEL